MLVRRGGRGAVRGRHERGGRGGGAPGRTRRGDHARPLPHGRARGVRPRVAHRHLPAGHHRPARRDAARQPRSHARALSAVVRVRHDRRLRGHALGRTGLHRLRTHRRARARPALRHPGGRDRGEAVPGHRGGAVAARAARGVGGRARGDHGGHVGRSPAARGEPLRGLVVPLVRRGLRGVQDDGAGGGVARRGAAIRRAGDRAVDGADLQRLGGGARRARLPAFARARRWLHRAGRLRGRGARDRRPPQPHAGDPARLRRAVSWPAPGTRLAPRALRRPLPARRPARPRRDGRDARDRHHLEPPRRALPGRGERAERVAHGAGYAAARDVPRVAPLPLGSFALLHVHRGPGAGRRARSVARGQVRGQRRHRGARRHDHPPPRRRA